MFISFRKNLTGRLSGNWNDEGGVWLFWEFCIRTFPKKSAKVKAASLPDGRSIA